MHSVRLITATAALLLSTLIHTGIQAQVVDFDSDRWISVNSQKKEYLGRKSLMGFAYLKDVDFQNGVIEVDMAVQRKRSYPGIIFRITSPTEYERVYLRPHRAGLYSDAVQYVSCFNGIDSWQLYNGEGMTASVELPYDQWFHVRLEVQGARARVFINNSAQPVLVVTDLQHGFIKGSVGLSGPVDGTAYFSNFRYRADNDFHFPEPHLKETPLGIIDHWELSQVFKTSEVDLVKVPSALGIDTIRWKHITPLRSGIVDISRYCGRRGADPDLIYARTFIESLQDTVVEYAFGYCDIISVFLNGKILFSANSAYQQRDPSFLGIIGLNDYIDLPLKKGKNELLIAVAEISGGWGFIFQNANAIFEDKRLTKVWELPYKLKYPESVVHDKKRDMLYVSNSFNSGNEFISKIATDGTIEDLQWIQGIRQPAGMCISNDTLFVVGRLAVVAVDLESGSIVNRYPFPQPQSPNDIDVDASGNLYISDTQADAFYKLSNGTIELWMQGDQIARPNGMLVDKNKLLVGTSGDGCIKSIDLFTRSIDTLVCIGNGSVMDGLKSDGKGHYLVSDNNGRVFLISPAGDTIKLLDTTVPRRLCADFEYIPDTQLLIIPTLYDNRLIAYKLLR